MRNISKRIIVKGVLSISLWVIGSIILIDNNNGTIISLITAGIIIAGLYSQMLKDKSGK